MSFLVDSKYDRHWQAVGKFIENEYWQRLWIVQEVILAPEAVTLCGTKAIKWSYLVLVLEMLPTFHISKVSKAAGDVVKYSLISCATQVARLKDRRSKGHVLPMYEGLIFGRSRSATEPRDYLYGILGIVKPNNVKPDYSRSIGQVYVDSVCHSLEVDRSANVLTGCKPSRSSAPWPVHNPELWPSWLPDWRIGAQDIEHLLPGLKVPGVEEYKDFQAGGKEHFGYEVSREYPILTLKGFFFDSVCHGSSTFGPLGTTDLQDDLKSHWTGWLSNRDQGQPYGDEKAQKDAFARTAIVGKLHANKGDETLAGGWTKWWDLYLGWPGYHPASSELVDLDISAGMRAASARFAAPQFFTTDKGYIGRGPANIQHGDMVCVFFGTDVPFILRPAPNRENQHYLIGECCKITPDVPWINLLTVADVDGIMNGEALKLLKDGTVTAREVALI